MKKQQDIIAAQSSARPLPSVLLCLGGRWWPEEAMPQWRDCACPRENRSTRSRVLFCAASIDGEDLIEAGAAMSASSVCASVDSSFSVGMMTEIVIAAMCRPILPSQAGFFGSLNMK